MAGDSGRAAQDRLRNAGGGGGALTVRIQTGRQDTMQRIVPSLWFDGNAEDAIAFYCSVFKNSKVVNLSRYGDAGPGPKGSVMAATFQLDGQNFFAINGGPQFKFTPAVSFLVNCATQQEIDDYWTKLSAGAQTQQCGWLQDKFGLSWQIVPAILGDLMKDAKKAEAVMKAILQMTKLDIATLKRAHDQA
jgi:predicted 3-demethylubiquinone-9 3-methyltransferase (glyoxalase superfamily)